MENPIKLIYKLHKQSHTGSLADNVSLNDLAEAVLRDKEKKISADFLDNTSALAIEAIVLMMEAGLNSSEVTKVLNAGVQQRLKVCRLGTNAGSKLLRQITFQEILNSMR